MRDKRCECPVCDFWRTNYMDVARHLYGMQDDAHVDAIKARLTAKSLTYPQLVLMNRNMTLLAKILESEAENV